MIVDTEGTADAVSVVPRVGVEVQFGTQAPFMVSPLEARRFARVLEEAAAWADRGDGFAR